MRPASNRIATGPAGFELHWPAGEDDGPVHALLDRCHTNRSVGPLDLPVDQDDTAFGASRGSISVLERHRPIPGTESQIGALGCRDVDLARAHGGGELALGGSHGVIVCLEQGALVQRIHHLARGDFAARHGDRAAPRAVPVKVDHAFGLAAQQILQCRVGSMHRESAGQGDRGVELLEHRPIGVFGGGAGGHLDSPVRRLRRRLDLEAAEIGRTGPLEGGAQVGQELLELTGIAERNDPLSLLGREALDDLVGDGFPVEYGLGDGARGCEKSDDEQGSARDHGRNLRSAPEPVKRASSVGFCTAFRPS